MTPYGSERDVDAARWVARMDSATWGHAEEAALAIWLAGDARRAGALLQAQAAWASLDGVELSDGAAVARPCATERHGEAIDRRRALAVGGGAIAASVAAGLLLTGRDDRYSTVLGEIRRVPLTDGSVAAINTSSELAVRFGDTRRSIRLERGEAWFQVAHDSTRPFVVKAGQVTVEAIGTAFGVRLREDGADILVTEGAVRAWSSGDGSAARSRTADGTRIAAGGAGAVRSRRRPSRAPGGRGIDRSRTGLAGRQDRPVRLHARRRRARVQSI